MLQTGESLWRQSGPQSALRLTAPTLRAAKTSRTWRGLWLRHDISLLSRPMHSSIPSLAQFVLGAVISGSFPRNLLEIRRPLIKRWNFCGIHFPFFNKSLYSVNWRYDWTEKALEYQRKIDVVWLHLPAHMQPTNILSKRMTLLRKLIYTTTSVGKWTRMDFSS